MVNRCGIATNCLNCTVERCIYDIRQSERKKKYYADHSEEIKANVKKWKAENPNKQKEYVKKYAMTHDRTSYYKAYYRRKKLINEYCKVDENTDMDSNSNISIAIP